MNDPKKLLNIPGGVCLKVVLVQGHIMFLHSSKLFLSCPSLKHRITRKIIKLILLGFI